MLDRESAFMFYRTFAFEYLLGVEEGFAMDAPLSERVRVLTELVDRLVAANKSLIGYIQEVEAGKRKPNANLEFFERMAIRDLQRLVDELRTELDKVLGG